MQTECSLSVRTYECDSYGHVNNANYLNYLEYARYEFLRAIGFDYEAFLAEGYGIYVAKIEIEYKRPALPDDVLTIRSYPVKKGAVSGALAQEVFRGEELVASARVTWACVSTKGGSAANGAPVRLPAAFDLPGLRP